MKWKETEGPETKEGLEISSASSSHRGLIKSRWGISVLSRVGRSPLSFHQGLVWSESSIQLHGPHCIWKEEDCLECCYKLCSNYTSTIFQLYSNYAPTTLQLYSNYSPTTLQLRSNYTPTSLQLRCNYAPTTFQLPPRTPHLISFHISCLPFMIIF